MDYWLIAHFVLWTAALVAAVTALRRVLTALKTLRNVYHYKLFPLLSRPPPPILKPSLYQTARRLIPLLGALSYSNPQFDLPPSLHLFLWLCGLSLTLIANYALSLLTEDEAFRAETAVGIGASSALICLTLGITVERTFVSGLNRTNRATEERLPELHEVMPKSAVSGAREAVETNNASSRRQTAIDGPRHPAELTFRVPQAVEVSSDSLLSGETEPKTDPKGTIEVLMLVLLVAVMIEMIWGVYVVGQRNDVSVKWCFLRWLLGAAVDFPVRGVMVLVLSGCMKNYTKEYTLLDYGLRTANFREFAKAPRRAESLLSPTAHTNLLPGSFQQDEQTPVATIEPLQPPSHPDSPHTPPPPSPRTPALWSASSSRQDSVRPAKPSSRVQSPLALPPSPVSRALPPAALSPTASIKGKTPPESLLSPASSRYQLGASPVASPKSSVSARASLANSAVLQSVSLGEVQAGSLSASASSVGEPQKSPNSALPSQRFPSSQDSEESSGEELMKETEGVSPLTVEVSNLPSTPQDPDQSDNSQVEESSLRPAEEDSSTPEDSPADIEGSEDEVEEAIEATSQEESPGAESRSVAPVRKVRRLHKRKRMPKAPSPPQSAEAESPVTTPRLGALSVAADMSSKADSNLAEAPDTEPATEGLQRSERSSEPPASAIPLFASQTPKSVKLSIEDEVEPSGRASEEEPEVVHTASSQQRGEADLETAANNSHRSSPEAEEPPVAFGDHFPVPEAEDQYSDIFSTGRDSKQGRPTPKHSGTPDSFSEPSKPYVPPTPLIRQRSKPPQPHPLRKRDPVLEDPEPSIVYPKGSEGEVRFAKSSQGKRLPPSVLRTALQAGSPPGSPEATDGAKMQFPLSSSTGAFPAPALSFSLGHPSQKPQYEPDVYNRPHSPTAANEDRVTFQPLEMSASGQVEQRRLMAEEFMEVARGQGVKSDVDLDKLGEKLAARADFHKKFGYKRTEFDSPYEEILWEMMRKEPDSGPKAVPGPQHQSHKVKLRSLMERYGTGSARPSATLSRHSSLAALGPRLRDISADMSRPKRKLYEMMSSRSTAALPPADILNIQVPAQAILEDPEDLSTPRREVWHS